METDTDIDARVHWMNPRHELERPVLKVHVGGLAEIWSAEVKTEYNSAFFVAKKVLYEDKDGDVQSTTEKVYPQERVPGYVADALLSYKGQYGPVDELANVINWGDDIVPDEPQTTLDAYFSEDRDG